MISHTHWDREWYQTQEEFRLRLIDLFDHLLETLDQNPEYVFHMDAQTIVFEDYWEIKPEMKEKCCKYIREGRILAGPWYVQNDFFLTSGEATVRNLLIGMKQANEMGDCAKSGYTPDQFGLISQLPQIYKGFGLDHCVFGRGYATIVENNDGTVERKNKPAEFIWKSPDGSEILGICMSHWYNNAQRFSADIDKAYCLVKNIEESFKGVATTPYLLLMNGVDHLECQPDLFPILEQVQTRLSEEEKIYQTTLEQYAECIRNAKSAQEMPIEVGELTQGTNDDLLADTASSRIYLKTQNSDLQNMLENRLEPLYTLLALSGVDGVYPAGELDYLWKMLIRNHAHDSICGCSTDAVHRHMEDRFAALKEMGNELQRRGMKQIAAHVTAGMDEKDYQIVVFNALERVRTEVIDVVIDIVEEDEPQGIRITDINGNVVPFEVLEHTTLIKSVFPAINLPGRVNTVRYKIRMVAADVPAFGYVTYRVETGHVTASYEVKQPIAYKKGQNYYLQNDAVEAVILPSGCINLLHKESGHCYEDILTIQDTADIGNAYIYQAIEGDTYIDIKEFTPDITIEETGEFVGQIRLHYDMTLPAYYDETTGKRSSETVNQPINIFIGLKKDAEALELRFIVDNKAKDHRMSAHICTGLKSDFTYATSPYDVVVRNKWDIDKRICNETQHNSGMVAIAEGDMALAILNRGTYGYEHLQSQQGTLTFPLVRANGRISDVGVLDDGCWKIPENQCLRTIETELALLPQKNLHLSKAVFTSKAYQNPLMVQCEPNDLKKFMGGRPAVQDTSIAEVFYQPIPHAEVQLARESSKFYLEGEGLHVSAFRKAFDRSGYILRFYNATEEVAEGILHMGNFQISNIWKTNLAETARNELKIIDNKISLSVKAKEIVTLFFKV